MLVERVPLGDRHGDRLGEAAEFWLEAAVRPPRNRDLWGAGWSTGVPAGDRAGDAGKDTHHKRQFLAFTAQL